MKFCLSLMTLLIWIPICPAQDIDMTKVCEEAANSSGLDAAGKANLNATCVQAAACSASCNRIIDDGDAFTACIQKCVLPDGDAPKIKPSNADSDKKKDAKDDKGDLCAQAADFRDHQLFNLWDTEQKKYAIFTEGSNAQVKIRDDTAKLMDDEWWAGSIGAEVAVEIKGFADVVNDTIGLFVPEGQAIQMGTSTIHHAREIANGVTGIGVLETYTKENAEAAAKQAGAEVFAKYGGQVGAGTKLLLDTAEYAKNKKDAENYRETVQAQVRRINETLRTLDDKRKAAVEKMDAYQEIVNGIDMLCANKPQKPGDASASIPRPH
jgi:hypothetical protein